jgi:TRAP-type C4-dicarboxylate transport system permease small subunit
MKSWLGSDGHLRRAAEAVQALMMAVMFTAFIAQVVFRYVINLPLAWTDEVCNLVWLWGIFWGASFVMRNSDDIRFDMVYTLLPAGVRRVLTLIASSALVLIFGLSIPASWSYVSFMKVERSASLGIPMNWVFSVYMLFALAMIVRHAGIVWDALHGRLVEDSLLDQVLQEKT